MRLHALLLICLMVASASAATVNVDISNFAFSPASVDINVGDSVVWTNKDTAPHTATGSGFGSGRLDSGQSFTQRFQSAGTFGYQCDFHPAMKGTVRVAAAAQSPPPAAPPPAQTQQSAQPSSSGGAGCCCDPQGRAQKPTILSSGDCTAPYTFQSPPTSFLIGKRVETVCQDFCGSQVGGIVVAPQIGCGSAELKPSPSNLLVTPLKGEQKIKLTWSQNCSEFVNAIAIGRCKGAGCTGFVEIAKIPFANSFSDPEELDFGQSYTYQLKTTFQAGTSEAVTVSGSPGDIECMGIKDASTICVSPLYYENFRDYFQTKGYKEKGASAFAAASFNKTISELFFSKFNKAMSCDDLNRLFTKKTCPDDKGDLCILDPSAPSGAVCAKSTNCQLLSPAHFGLNFSVSTCEGGVGKRNFCFLDRSRSLADQCFNCLQGMGCFDYRSKGACERNNCGAGSCEWRDVFPGLGIGVCVDTRFDNCKLCSSKGTQGMQNLDAYNEIFDQCTDQKAQALSSEEHQCFFNSRTGTASGCSNVDCTAYGQTQCGSPSGGIRLDQNNNVVGKSTDSCGLGVCQYDPTVGCAKNADGAAANGDFRDCAGLDGKPEEACERDIFPPETQLIAIKGPKGATDEIEIIRRDRLTEFELPKKVLAKDNPTFFCVGDGCVDFKEYTQDKLFVDNTLLQKIGEGNKAEIFAVLKEGKNTIRYFTKDKQKNVELVGTFSFDACAACQGPKVLNVSVSNSVLQEGVYHTRDALPQITVFFNKDIRVISSEIIFGTLNLPANPSPQGSQATFSASQALEEGAHTLKVSATDTNGLATDKPVEVKFVVDTIAPTLTILVNNNATPGVIVRQPSAQITLNFSEKVELGSVIVRSTNFTRFTAKPLEFNLTTKVSASQGTSFSVAHQGPEGENIIAVTAVDLAGHPVLPAPHPFRIFTLPPKIRLKQPSFGVSSTFTFPLEVETQNPAQCRFWFNTGSPLIPAPEDFASLEAFELTGFVSHLKNGVDRIKQENVKFPLTVRCQTDQAKESKEVFDLSVDTTPPLMISAFATPDPVVQKPFVTSLKVQTDDETFCKASKTAASYSAMELLFPGFEELGAKVHELEVEEQNVGDKRFNVACLNLAQLGPALANITFSVREGIPFTITSNTPRYTSNLTFALAIETNKDASCYQSKDKAQLGTRIGVENISRVHVTSVTESAEGTYSYFVTCATGGETVIGAAPETAQIQVNVTIDSTPPSMLLVNDDSPLFADKELSYFTDHIRAKWKGEDRESGVPKYFYTVKDATTQQQVVPQDVSDKTDYFVDIYFEVQDKARYVVDAKAVNGVGMESAVLSSDGVDIDFSRVPQHCLNGQIDPDFKEVDVDCSGECYKCKANQRCNENQDCVSDFCVAGICQNTRCDDKTKNGRETDVDCGGQCGDCQQGRRCLIDRDCASRFCAPEGVCQRAPPCQNHKLDGTETDVDCGGACPNKCASGLQCKLDSDCAAGTLCVKVGESAIKKCLGDEDLKALNKDQDTDGDGMPDWFEEKYSLDDPNEDADGDGLTNLQEYEYFQQTGREISPMLWDTDGDGWNDFLEISRGFNPVDAKDYPQSLWWYILAVAVFVVGFGLVGYYAFLQYKEYKETRPAPQIRVAKKLEERPDIIKDRAEKVKFLLKEEPKEFLDVVQMKKVAERELVKKEKRAGEVFADLQAVRSGKPVTHRPRHGAISGLRAFRKEQRGSPPEQKTRQRLALISQMRNLSAEEKKQLSERLKKLAGPETSQAERKKLLDSLKMTSQYYEQNKEELQAQAKQWFELKSKIEKTPKKKK